MSTTKFQTHTKQQYISAQNIRKFHITGLSAVGATRTIGRFFNTIRTYTFYKLQHLFFL